MLSLGNAGLPLDRYRGAETDAEDGRMLLPSLRLRLCLEMVFHSEAALQCLL